MALHDHLVYPTRIAQQIFFFIDIMSQVFNVLRVDARRHCYVVQGIDNINQYLR
jgi:hypothetical protein